MLEFGNALLGVFLFLIFIFILFVVIIIDFVLIRLSKDFFIITNGSRRSQVSI